MSEEEIKRPIGAASPRQQMVIDCIRNNDAQIVIIGGAAGSGKSHLLQMLPLEFADCPKARCIMFRRETDQLKGQGGLFELATDIYNDLPKELRPRMVQSKLRAYFPTGAQVQWKHMERETDRIKHQGLTCSPYTQ